MRGGKGCRPRCSSLPTGGLGHSGPTLGGCCRFVTTVRRGGCRGVLARLIPPRGASTRQCCCSSSSDSSWPCAPRAEGCAQRFSRRHRPQPRRNSSLNYLKSHLGGGPAIVRYQDENPPPQNEIRSSAAVSFPELPRQWHSPDLRVARVPFDSVSDFLHLESANPKPHGCARWTAYRELCDVAEFRKDSNETLPRPSIFGEEPAWLKPWVRSVRTT